MMRVRKSIVMVCAVLLCSKTVRAETTFLANYNRLDATGQARFLPDDRIGAGETVSVAGTSAGETVDLPAGTAPTLSSDIRVHSGPAALDLRGGRDGLFYTGLAAGNVNRGEGTAEGFFRTPYPLAGNSEPRALLSAWVLYASGGRWFWQLDVEGDRLVARLEDSGSGGGSVTLQSLPFSERDWAPHTWHHVALTWKAGEMVQLFVNGKLAGRASAAALPLTPAMEAADGNRIYIGMRAAGTGGPNGGQGANLEGWVDSVRFDNTVLFDGTGRAVGEAVFTPPAAESWRSLGVFSSGSTVWQASGGAPATQRVFDRRTKGYEFTCDFARVAERCYWDAATTLDLSNAVSLIGWVHVTNAAAIEGVNIHFKSGGGWYNATVPVSNGWNDFALQLSHMSLQGTPAGMERVDTVRISAWRSSGAVGPASIVVYDVEASRASDKERPFEYPEYDIALNPVRPLIKDPASGAVLESRMIMDEAPNYLSEGSEAVLDKIARAGLNVYMPCVWHGRGAIYRSDTSILDLQYAPKFGGTLDPFADLIKAAHARGIEVHGWFTVALRQANIYPEFAEPGTPADAFDLQNPGFRDFIVNEIIGFVKKYDVDGINLDYIRTTGISFSRTASALYFQRFGRDIEELRQSPMPPEVETRFLIWQRDAVSDIVRRVREATRRVKPDLVISVSGYPQKKPFLHQEGRNEWLWVENDWVDLVYMMAYAPSPDLTRLNQVRQSSLHPHRFAVLGGNYDSAPGIAVSRPPDLLVRQIDYFLRKYPEGGVGLYLYNQLSEAQVAALRNGPFREPAVPYWKRIKNLVPPGPPVNLKIIP